MSKEISKRATNFEEENEKLRYKVKVQQGDIDCLRNEIERLEGIIANLKSKRFGEDFVKER